MGTQLPIGIRPFARPAARALTVAVGAAAVGFLGVAPAAAATDPVPLPAGVSDALKPPVPVPGPVGAAVAKVAKALGVADPLASTPTPSSRKHKHRPAKPAVRLLGHAAPATSHHPAAAARHHSTSPAAVPAAPAALPAGAWRLPTAMTPVVAQTLSPTVAPLPGATFTIAPATASHPAPPSVVRPTAKDARDLAVVLGALLVAVAVGMHAREAARRWPGGLRAALAG
ncbi:MAG: hypothetical protein JO222_06425 [Frankiales bacterium]|nr:hypothetical protein [Frankiales bacterium]